jgi:hypothetical protein
MNLDEDEFPDETQIELLTELTETAILQEDTYSAICFDALARIDPDNSINRLKPATQVYVEYKKIA